MGLSDVFDFELFNAKDMLSKVKKDPWRLALGAVDPLSTKMWSGITGKKMEPIVDQMGGAYGGHSISAFGNDDGGVYKRAREAGIDTKAGGRVHDLAHVLSAFYGGQGLMGLGGKALGGAQGGQQGLGIFSNGGQAGMSGVGQGNVGTLAANTGINTGGVGGVGGTGASSSSMLQQMLGKGGFGSMPGMSVGAPPQQQQPPPQFNPNLGAQANAQVGNPNMTPPMGQRIMGGLGRARDALTPVDPRVAATTDPAYIQQMRNNAMLQLGLGMMANAHQGGRFGEALAAGLGQSQATFNKGMEGAYERGVIEREDKRRLDRQELLDSRYNDEREYLKSRDAASDARDVRDFNATQDYRNKVLAERNKDLQQGRIPAGYRVSADGNLEPIPGGPADPAGPSARKAAQTLRKEFRGLESVKSYETSLPMLQSAKSAPDTGYGDMDLIYAVGKTLDPGSVVREGELALTIKAGSPIERLVGTTRFTIGEGGRLTPNQRKQLVAMLENRVQSYKQMYDRDFQQYSTYASQMGLSPDLVVGTPAERAYEEADPLGIR